MEVNSRSLVAVEEDVAIELQSVDVIRDGKKILDDTSIKLSRGDNIALIGPSGSGKSTLIKVILGLIKTSTGRIFIEGVKPKNTTHANTSISYVPQNVGIYSDSVLFNITMSNKVSKEAKDKCRLVLERLGCDFFGDLRSADLARIRLQ